MRDTATTYWLLDASQNQEATAAQKLEPLLIGRQLRISEMLGALRLHDSALDLSAVDELVNRQAV